MMALSLVRSGSGCAWRCLFALCILATTQSHAQEPSDPPARTACALEPGPTRAVTHVIDTETLALDDGSEVRLLGALGPRAPDSTLDASFWPPEREARTALERLVLGRSITLAFSGRRADRYGRTLAHVFVEPTTDELAKDPATERVWVQAHMLGHGHARAYVLKENLGCLRELAAHEAYQVRDASRAQELMRLRSTFQIVEGAVTSFIQGRTTLILRFGREPEQAATDDTGSGSRGFSIAVKPAIVRMWALDGLTLEQIVGRRLRIHGWIERRGGPIIEILDAHQIEFVDETPQAASAQATDEATPPSRRRSRKASRDAATGAPLQN
jgi:micrococcal nuclease